MATHPSILAWRIPWTEERSLVGNSPRGHKEPGMTEGLSIYSGLGKHEKDTSAPGVCSGGPPLLSTPATPSPTCASVGDQASSSVPGRQVGLGTRSWNPVPGQGMEHHKEVLPCWVGQAPGQLDRTWRSSQPTDRPCHNPGCLWGPQGATGTGGYLGGISLARRHGQNSDL